ncbi:MAG TPA: UDP-3-O-(3-hydroxymyristoyl)glucosamine N-acyltransferase [Kiritimatiellia bacterium]|nr:UDP-3-O-(3-hydroxymyristoyl)glucosamine N-acyltransferase [Kiritimatiellia bacterium]
MGGLLLSDIAGRLNAVVEGDAAIVINGVAGIRYAEPGDLSFVSQARYAADAATTKASALLVAKDWRYPVSAAVIRVDQPEAVFAEVASWFAAPAVTYAPGIHPTAVIASGAVIGSDVHIGPYCVIGPEVSLGDRTVLVGHNVLGSGVSIGDDGLLYPMVTIREYVKIGNRFIAHNGVVIGSDGFGYDVDGQGVRTKIPQIGIVEIGDDVEIGANSTVDRARFGKTRIGNGVKIDNLVMVAHNVTIGDHAVLVSQVGIAGSSSVGHHAILAGQAGVAGHLEIGPGALVLAQAGVTKDVPAKAVVMGFPATPQKEFATNQAALNRLPQLKKRLAELEARIAALESPRG